MEYIENNVDKTTFAPQVKEQKKGAKLKKAIKEKMEDILISLETSEGHKKDQYYSAGPFW